MTRFATGENGDARALGWVGLSRPQWRRTGVRARAFCLGRRRVSEADHRSAFTQWRSGFGEEVAAVRHASQGSFTVRSPGSLRANTQIRLRLSFASALMPPEPPMGSLRRAHWGYALWKRPSIVKSYRCFSRKLPSMAGGSGRTRHFRKVGLNWGLIECN